MTESVRQLEDAVRNLSSKELAEFRSWYAEFDAEQWDRQFEEDVAEGRLDWLAEEAKANRQAGHCTDR